MAFTLKGVNMNKRQWKKFCKKQKKELRVVVSKLFIENYKKMIESLYE